MTSVTVQDVDDLASGFHPDAAHSFSLRSAAYTEAKWLQADRAGIFARSWQLGTMQIDYSMPDRFDRTLMARYFPSSLPFVE